MKIIFQQHDVVLSDFSSQDTEEVSTHMNEQFDMYPDTELESYHVTLNKGITTQDYHQYGVCEYTVMMIIITLA